MENSLKKTGLEKPIITGVEESPEKLNYNKLEIEKAYDEMYNMKPDEVIYKTKMDEFIWEHLPLSANQKRELLQMVEKEKEI